MPALSGTATTRVGWTDSGPRPGAFLWILVTLLIGGWVVWPSLPDDPVSATLTVLVGTTLVGIGYWFRATTRGEGWWLVAAGLAWIAGDLGAHDEGPWPFIGWLLDPLDGVLLALCFLRYPDGRWHGTSERGFAYAAIGWTIGARALPALTFDPSWAGYEGSAWWPTLFPASALHPAAGRVYWAGVLVLGLWFVVLVARRLTGYGRAPARELLPFAAGMVIAAVTVLVEAAVRLRGSGQIALDIAFVLQQAAVCLLILGLVASLLTRRLALAHVGQLLTDVPGAATPDAVRDSLRRLLHDPELTVGFWVPERDSYVQCDGGPLDEALPVVATVNSTDGSPLLVICSPHAYPERHELLVAASRAVALKLDNARLHATLLAHIEELRRSRARIITAGLAERRRVERDLHDGAQQQLLSMGTTLSRLRRGLPDGPAAVLADQAGEELRQALTSLRDLAHGIHPAVLHEGGLGPALGGVAERMDIPVELDVPTARYPEQVEAALYFCACEILANATKHASPSRMRLSLRRDGHHLRMVVTDNGTGGATIGTGITNVQDRAAALGGTVSITSPRGGPTTVTVAIPCG